jgi:hypothetical protein
VRHGLLRLRPDGAAVTGRPGTAETAVLAVLRELHAAGRESVLRGDISQRLADHGLSYSVRAVNAALARLAGAQTPLVEREGLRLRLAAN